MAKVRRRQPRPKRKLPIFALGLMMLALFFASYTLAKEFLFPVDPFTPDEMAMRDDYEEDFELDNRLNFLLLGTDAREGEKVARTDSIILVSIDKDTNRISMLSIPRDTRVSIPGYGTDKINAAYVHGGPKLASRTVSNLLGIPIDYYMVTRFEGFKDIVDALGGVEFEVHQNMYYSPESINLQRGHQLLDGDKALQFVRYRSYPSGDIERTVQQQRFLKALAEQTLQPNKVTKLPKIAYSINKNIETNMGLSQMIKLAKAAKGLNDTDIVTQTLPGRFMTIDGISYWHVEPGSVKKSLALLLNGETSSVIEGQTIVQGNPPATGKKLEEQPPVEQGEREKPRRDRDEEERDRQNNQDQRDDAVTPQPPAPPDNEPEDDTIWLPPVDNQPNHNWQTQGS